MKFLRALLIASLTPLALATGVYAASARHGEHSKAAALTKAQMKFLANYEGIRAALATDNLEDAKRSAANMGESSAAVQLSKATSLNAAREAFKKLSEQAVQLAKGRDEYYVVNCPMAGADWVQTRKTVSNPYFGSAMATCGSIKD